MLVNQVVPFTLGSYSLNNGKGQMVQKADAIGLGAYALISFLKDGLGLGQNNPLNRKF